MKLLVVDDHPIVVAACRTLFESESEFSVIGAQSAAAARRDVRRFHPDIVIVDLNLPDASGLEFIRELRRDHPLLKIIVFSVSHETRIAVQALHLGAMAVVCKLGETETLREAVFAAARGEVQIPDALKDELAAVSQSDARFTGREQEVLRQLSNGRSIMDIASALGVSYSTVAKLCSALREKFEARSLPELVRIATELKLV